MSQRPTVTEVECDRWSRIYRSPGYFYGDDPGPVARRAVRYHRPSMPHGGSALDIGCGEGQDLAFLAEEGYRAVGLELTEIGVQKSRRLLERRGLEAEVVHGDATTLSAPPTYDLVLAVNSLQFLGEGMLAALERTMAVVSPGGVLGLSLFAREPAEPELRGTVAFIQFDELMERFAGWQRIEAARLWQWNVHSDSAQAFATLIARKAPPARATPLGGRQGGPIA